MLIAESEGEATNLEAQVAEYLYICMFTCTTACRYTYTLPPPLLLPLPHTQARTHAHITYHIQNTT